MGYSVAAPVRSPKLRDKMMALLDREYRKWPVVAGRPDGNSYLRGPRADDLSYHEGRCYIGYDYNANGAEREYAFCVVRWIAITIGRKMPGGLPYYVYDGDEVIPLLVNGDKQRLNCETVDRFGVLLETPDCRKYEGALGRLKEIGIFDEDAQGFDLIRAEIQRLDALWAKESRWASQ